MERASDVIAAHGLMSTIKSLVEMERLYYICEISIP